MNISKILVNINNRKKLNSITFKDNKQVGHTNRFQNNLILKSQNQGCNENKQNKSLYKRKVIPWIFLCTSITIALIYFRYLIKVELPELRKKYGKILDRTGNLKVNSR